MEGKAAPQIEKRTALVFGLLLSFFSPVLNVFGSLGRWENKRTVSEIEMKKASAEVAAAEGGGYQSEALKQS